MSAPHPAAPCCETLLRRADFLRVARAERQGMPGFLLQARRRTEGEAHPAAIRIGFTCSRKLGNAVTRNRAKRRLRAAARAVIPAAGRPGWDYVLVGRPETTVTRGFADLTADLTRALERIHRRAAP
jgi:ribonuclease P protein component